MSKSIDRLVDNLPSSGLTVRVLGLLDFAAPGQWQNTIGFDNMIRSVSGESDAVIVANIRARALELYNDSSQGYQRAISVYQLVDNAGGKAGLSSMAQMLGEKFGILSSLTPKQDKAQTLDLALKLIFELVAFCNANGFPGDGISDFMSAVTSYKKENLIRLSAIVVFDGLIPLGPDYAAKLLDSLSGWSPADLENNSMFQRLKGFIPGGDSPDSAFQFFSAATFAMNGYVGSFASAHGFTVGKVLDQLHGVIDFSEGKLDLLAAFLDVATNYVEHTGIQSVSRSLIERAVGEN